MNINRYNKCIVFLFCIFLMLVALQSNAQEKSDSAKAPCWYIKYNPAASLRADHELSIERVAKKYSLELSAGVTTRNVFFEALQGRLFDNNYTPVENRKWLPGFSLKGTAKLYLGEGFYLGAQGAWIRYNYEFPLANVDPSQRGYQKENIQFYEGRGLLGWQWMPIKTKLMLDFYAGFGVKHRVINFYEEQSYFDSGNNYVFDSGTFATSKNVIGVYMGIKVGVRLK